MPKFTSADGKTILFSYTRGGVYEYVIKLVSFEGIGVLGGLGIADLE